MARNLDCIGKVCPVPVVETLKMLAGMPDGEVIEVSVDNYVAVQNLTKMAVQKHLPVSSEKRTDTHYVVTITAAGANEAQKSEEILPAEVIACGQQSNEVVVLASDKMGEGDEKLGRSLMKGYIYALTELSLLPKTVLMYNNGAKLGIEGSDSLADLKLLESQGVEIMTCGTCLNFYGITEKLGVGTVTNMYAISEKLSAATKVIKP